MGAEIQKEWLYVRLQGEPLARLAHGQAPGDAADQVASDRAASDHVTSERAGASE
jgi:hypothetical protein